MSSQVSQVMQTFSRKQAACQWLKGLVPFAVVALAVWGFYCCDVTRVASWVDNPKPNYPEIKRVVENNPALFTPHQRIAIREGDVDACGSELAEAAAEERKNMLDSELAPSLYSLCALAFLFSIRASFLLSAKVGMKIPQTETMPKTAMTAEFHMVRHLMLVAGVMISLVGAATFWQLEANIPVRGALLALVCSLASGFYALSYVWRGIDSETANKVTMGRKAYDKRDTLVIWQFWLVITGAVLIIASVALSA